MAWFTRRSRHLMCPTRQYIIDRSHKIQPMQRHTPCRAIRASRGEVGLESSGGYVLNTTPLLGSKFETCMPWSREQQQRPADKVASLLNDCYYCLGRWISPPPPWGGFQARLFDIQEGTNTERDVLGKLSSEMFLVRRTFWHRHSYSKCGDIDQ